MTLEKLLQDVHRAAEEKARIDTCVEIGRASCRERV